jgi:Protein of unknown function (DUF3485)
MNPTKWIFAALGLLLIGGGGVVLLQFKAHQKLGEPGVKTRPLANSRNLEVVLPETVLDYTSEWLAQDAIVTNTLPSDTSFGSRRYTAPDQFSVQVTVVLMGSDRTSLHKPQFCLTGAGWAIDNNATREETVRMEQPRPYDLPVVKYVASRQMQHEGRTSEWRGIYVYWFVADDAISATESGLERMWAMAHKLVTTGVLQRWAYISYFAVCPLGQEEATYERLKKLIAASAPEFQLPPKPGTQVAATRP